MIDEEITFGHPVDHSKVAKDNLFDVTSITHAYEDDVRSRSDIAGSRHDIGTQSLGFFRSSIPHGDLMSSLDQVGRHAPAHDPQTDESKSRHQRAP